MVPRHFWNPLDTHMAHKNSKNINKNKSIHFFLVAPLLLSTLGGAIGMHYLCHIVLLSVKVVAACWRDGKAPLGPRTESEHLMESNLHAALGHEAIAPPRVDSSKGPQQVNRAHWPNKENRQKFNIFYLYFVRSMATCLGWPQTGPG